MKVAKKGDSVFKSVEKKKKLMYCSSFSFTLMSKLHVFQGM